MKLREQQKAEEKRQIIHPSIATKKSKKKNPEANSIL